MLLRSSLSCVFSTDDRTTTLETTTMSRLGEAIYWTKSHGFYYTLILLPFLFCRFMLGSRFTYSKESYLELLGISKERVFWLDFSSYEKNVQKAVVDIHGDLFIDVGAHLGQYPLLLWRNFRRIIALEPHPDNYKVLEENISREGISNVIFLKEAASDSDGMAMLYVGDFDGHTLEEERHRGLPQHDGKGFLVKTVTIDTLVRESKYDSIDLLKIDAEGSESRVLSGARESIKARKIKNIEVEVHPPTASKEAVEDFLKEYYNTRWLDSHHIFGELR